MDSGSCQLGMGRNTSHIHFVDNLPPSMSNVWLHQYFRMMVTLWMYLFQIKSVLGCFDYVHFSKRAHVEAAASRNNGLMIKGFKITTKMSKENRIQRDLLRQNTNQQRSIPSIEKQVWRPAIRADRTYNKVIRPIIEGNSKGQLNEWLPNALICSEVCILELRHAKDKILESRVTGVRGDEKTG